MKKTFKWLAVLVAIVSVIGIIVSVFCSKKEEAEIFDFTSDEEDDFNLDSDLQPVEREYVPLNQSASAEKEEAAPTV